MKKKKRAKTYEPKLAINATLDEVLKIVAKQGDRIVKERQNKKK